ncbi:MAG TPA: helix-turn-helix transcriptional regulator, partial [Burkholderiaceae bacterium]|nr:helix-turn-helix transcriptional regulator [Burkholderiaceae bacterium]
MSDQSGEGPLTSVGSAEQLAAAREQRGLGRAEVAQRLKLHVRQLDAIERGDWAALPGRAFVRGAVRSYGRLLGVDVDALLQSIGGFAEAEELRPSASLAAPLPRGGAFGFDPEGKGSRWPWAVLGVVAVIAVALFFGNDGDVDKVTSWIGKSDAPAASAPAAPSASSGDGATSSGAPAGSPLVLPPLVPPADPAPGGTAPAAPGAAPAT